MDNGTEQAAGELRGSAPAEDARPESKTAAELRREAFASLPRDQGQAQIIATLAVAAAIEELTGVVRLIAPTVDPDPEAGKGYAEFELEATESLELDIER